MRLRLRILCILCAFFVLRIIQPVSSQSLGIDPLLIERAVSPGSSISYTVNVQNDDGFEPITLAVSVADVFENLNGVYNLLEAGSSAFSLAEWVSFEPEIITIPPASERRISVTITVPRGVSGGRYGAIVISPKEDISSLAESTAPFVYRMASFIELEITGSAARKEAYISRFSVQPSSALPRIRQQVGDNALVYSAEVTNVGNVHIITQGSVLLQTAEGRTVARFPIGGGRGIILPENTVALQSVTKRGLLPGDYIARAVIEYGGQRPAVSEIEFSITESAIDAQEQSAVPLSRFTVEPEEIDVAVRPGALNSTILEISNKGLDPIEVDTEIMPLEFSILGELLTEEERGEAPDWITINPSSFSIEPGRTKRVRLLIRPPKDTDGGYYADLILTSKSEAGTTKTGSSILVFVGEKIIKSGKVEVVNIEQEQEFIYCDVLFTNDGNYHVNVGLDFVLRRVYEGYIDEETGRVVPRQTEGISSISLPMSINPVLPSTKRGFSFQIPTSLEPGEYEIAIRADYGGDEPALTQLPFRIEGGEGQDE